MGFVGFGDGDNFCYLPICGEVAQQYKMIEELGEVNLVSYEVSEQATKTTNYTVLKMLFRVAIGCWIIAQSVQKTFILII